MAEENKSPNLGNLVVLLCQRQMLNQNRSGVDVKAYMDDCIRKLSDIGFSTFEIGIVISLFAIMILVGIIGSFLIIYAVVRNAQMRTSRNLIITNLAVGDLILCVFTQPLGVYKVLGSMMNASMCRIASFSQSANLFVATLSITAIALDRFQVLTCQGHIKSQRIFVRLLIFSIWLIGLLIALPTVFFTDAGHSYIHKTQVCTLKMDLKIYHTTYIICVLISVYCLPALLVPSFYLKILYQMRNREDRRKKILLFPYELSQNNPSFAEGVEYDKSDKRTTKVSTKSSADRRAKKAKRATLLLLSITGVFLISWLPLHLWNLLSTIVEINDMSLSLRALYWIQIFCMLSVLMSSCLNPILYGWLNSNFRAEFYKIFSSKLSLFKGPLATIDNKSPVE